MMQLVSTRMHAIMKSCCCRRRLVLANLKAVKPNQSLPCKLSSLIACEGMAYSHIKALQEHQAISYPLHKVCRHELQDHMH